MLTGPVWVLGKAAVAGRPAHRLPLGSSRDFRRPAITACPGEVCGASVAMACGTQGCSDLSILEVTDMREPARGARGVVHPPKGSQSLVILC